MPTYQYACTECRHGFDIVQSFSDDSLSVCPECGGRLRKVFNAVGVVFKGSGFYKTDSRAKASSDSGSSSESTSTTTKDANGSGGTSASTKSDKSDSSTTTKTESAKA